MKQLYTISNGKISADITDFGARVVRLFVPDKQGRPIDVVAGFDDLDAYENDFGTYFGAVVGRVANRIGGSAFTLNGKRYTLFANDNANHLHGGKCGFDSRMWKVISLDDTSLTLSYHSADGEEGYPANLNVEVTYSIDGGDFGIAYRATSDGDTPCSLTNHTYFNLDGDFKSIRRHTLYINSDRLTIVNGELIPTGETLRLEGTPYDFSSPKEIGRDIDEDSPLLKLARGYDFNYVLCGEHAATAIAERSGIRMQVYTDRPCMQLYTGNFLGGIKGKRNYGYQSAFCLETQGYPNAVNVKKFPSCILKAGEEYRTSTIYRFDTL